MDQTLDEFLAYLITEGSAWIGRQRERLRPTASNLQDEQIEHLSAHFRPETLGTVRYQLIDHIENPAFYEELIRNGIDIPLDFSQMVGITFYDTISISRKKLRRQYLIRLLFHECVHVAQYRHLGVAAFISRYVQGWADHGFNYFTIPLERQAYELERRYAQGEIFSVEEEVAEFIDP